MGRCSWWWGELAVGAMGRGPFGPPDYTGAWNASDFWCIIGSTATSTIEPEETAVGDLFARVDEVLEVAHSCSWTRSVCILSCASWTTCGRQARTGTSVTIYGIGCRTRRGWTGRIWREAFPR